MFIRQLNQHIFGIIAISIFIIVVFHKKKYIGYPPSFSDLLVFARLIESLDQHNIRGLPSMKITLIYSGQDIPTTKWETLEISQKSYNFQVIPNLQIFPHKNNGDLFEKLLSLGTYLAP